MAPPWLPVLGASMRWCGLDKVKIPQMAGLKALDDCFAASERAKSKGYGPATQAWHDASSGRCAVASLQRAVEGESKGERGLRKPLPYALAVAHLLRQRGDNRKLAGVLAKMEPQKLADFAAAHIALLRKGKGASC